MRGRDTYEEGNKPMKRKTRIARVDEDFWILAKDICRDTEKKNNIPFSLSDLTRHLKPLLKEMKKRINIDKKDVFKK